MPQMKCLSVNTANSLLSIALMEDDRVLYAYETDETRNQGNLLLSHIDLGLKGAGCAYADLGLMAVVTGPGSFTGIRIGISAMRGLAFASNVPLMGLSSFDLFREEKAGRTNIICLESWREELYLQCGDDQPINQKPADFAASLSKSQKFFISGDARHKLKEFLPDAEVSESSPSATEAAMLTMVRFKKDGAGERPVPFYLRDADVSFSSKNRKTEGISGG